MSEIAMGHLPLLCEANTSASATGPWEGFPSTEERRAALAAIASWAGHAPTPVLALPGLAAALGVASVAVKHEGLRFGVGSFKALGPPYAIHKEMSRRREGGAPPLRSVVAPTSGNHGIAVAWAARRFGLDATIFAPYSLPDGRARAIRALGARLALREGGFDAAAEAALAFAERAGALLVGHRPDGAETSADHDVLAGYAIIAAEIAVETPQPTHVFVSAGGGMLAAAIFGGLKAELGAQGPCCVSVEPTASDVVRRSLAAGRPVRLDRHMPTAMDGLVVGAPAKAAWPTLRAGVDLAIAIPDAVLEPAAAAAADLPTADAGPTGLAALAGLIAAASDPAFRAMARIDASTRLLAVMCEAKIALSNGLLCVEQK